MAMLKNVEMWWVRCNPKRPNDQHDKQNPSWEVQIRTNDPAKKDELLAQNVRLKLDKYPEGHAQEGEIRLDENGQKLWKLTLRKKSLKSKLVGGQTVLGEPNKVPEVIGGDLAPIDPDTVANGSIGNIRVHQYPGKPNPDGSEKISSMLMAIQVVKHIVYTPGPRDDDFEPTETTRVDAAPRAPSTSSPSAPGSAPVDQRDDEAF